MPTTRGCRVAITGALLLSACGVARGQVDAFWASASSGNWEDPTRWSTNPVYPDNDSPTGTHYRAVFQAAGPSYTAQLRFRTVSVDDVLIDSTAATLEVGSGGVLNVANQFDLRQGTLRLAGGDLSGTIAINGGVLDVRAGRLRDVRILGAWNAPREGQFRIAGSSFEFDQINFIRQATLTFEDSMTLSNSSITHTSGNGGFVLGVTTGKTLTLAPTFSLTVGDGTIGNPTGGEHSFLVNEGTIRANSPNRTVVFAGDATSGSWLTNHGLIRAENGATIRINSLVESLGRIEADGAGTSVLVSAASPSGTSTPADGPVSATNGAVFTIQSSWEGTGTFSATTGGKLRFGGLFNASVLANSSGDAPGSIEIFGQANNAGTLVLDPATGVVLAGGEIRGGTVDTAPSTVLPLMAGTSSRLQDMTFAGQADVQNATLAFNGAWSVTGAANAGDGGIIELGGGAFTTPQLANITRSGTGQVRVAANGTWNALGSTVAFGPTSLVTGVNGRVNADEISVDAGHVFTTPGSLSADDFTGAGTITLQNGSGLLIPGLTSGNAVIHAGLTVTGNGKLGSNALEGVRITNQGTIRAQSGQQLYIDLPEFVNEGVLEVAGGTIDFGVNPQSATPAWSNSGTIQVSSGNLFLGGTYSTSGMGTITNTGGTVFVGGFVNNVGQTLSVGPSSGTWRAAAGGRIDGGTVEAQPGGSFLLNGAELHGVALRGSFPLDSATITSGLSVDGELVFEPFASLLSFTGDQTFAAGTVLIPDTTSAQRRIRTLGNTSLVLGPDVEIRGGEVIIGNNESGTRSTGTLTNQGEIIADVPGRIVNIGADTFVNEGLLEARDGGIIKIAQPNRGGQGVWSNSGIIRAVNGGRVEVTGTVSTSDIGVLETSGGSFVFASASIDNTGQTFHVGPATGNVSGKMSFKGGLLDIAPGYSLIVQNASTFDGLSVSGNVIVERFIAIRNGLTLDGTIHLTTPRSGLYFYGDNNSLTSGTVSFEGPEGDDRIVGGDETNISSFVIGQDATVRGGRGAVRSSNLATIENRGLISADVSGQKIKIYTARFFNFGTVQAVNGGIIENIQPPGLAGDGVFVNSGILLMDPGSRIQAFGDLVNEPGAILRLLVRGPSSEASIRVDGTVFLDGTLELLTLSGRVPRIGEHYAILSASSYSGDFDQLLLPALPDGLAWHTSSLGITGDIWVVPAPASVIPLAGVTILVGRRRRSERRGA
jgi:hypothetical protein